MHTDVLKRKIAECFSLDLSLAQSLGLGDSDAEIERLRKKLGGSFGVRTGRRYWDWAKGMFLWEPTSEWVFGNNIFTNEGIAYALDVGFREVADIAPWYIIGYTDAGTYTPAAGDTYAVPNFTECDGADLDETVRQAWVDGSPSGTTTRVVAGTAVTYTGDQSFNMQGAAMVGGGSAASTLADTAGGGTLACASDFASPVPMTLDATVDITYSVQTQDDGA